MNAWVDKADERLTTMIQGLLGEKVPFITGWVLAVTFVDDEGDPCTAFNSMDGQRRTATLGMLAHALEVERAAVFWDEKPE